MKDLANRIADRALRAKGTSDEGNVNTNNEHGSKTAAGWGDQATNGTAVEQSVNLTGTQQSGFTNVVEPQPTFDTKKK